MSEISHTKQNISINLLFTLWLLNLLILSETEAIWFKAYILTYKCVLFWSPNSYKKPNVFFILLENTASINIKYSLKRVLFVVMRIFAKVKSTWLITGDCLLLFKKQIRINACHETWWNTYIRFNIKLVKDLCSMQGSFKDVSLLEGQIKQIVE
jgi:hypothetical protein